MTSNQRDPYNKAEICRQNYPPVHNEGNPSYTSFASSSATFTNIKGKSDVDVQVRYVSRTPSPTPSETAALNRKGLFDWKEMMNWRYWIRKEWICAYHC